MRMSSSKLTSILSLALFAAGCGTRDITTIDVDCSVADAYEFRNIDDFNDVSAWYSYGDPTPVPKDEALSYTAEPISGRCNNPTALKIEAHGYNFWGTGFANYRLEGMPAVGTGYEGISFWARTGTVSDRTFMLYVDDGSTLFGTAAKARTGVVVDDVCHYVCSAADSPDAPDEDGFGDENNTPCVYRAGAADTGVSCTAYQQAGPNDTDENGDGLLGPGDIAAGTTCRIPPIQDRCDPACYYGGAQPPTVASCVPAPDQCGNQFHKYITTTDRWQMFFIPWNELPQWPCPNRKAGGIDVSDIRKFEIKLVQGSSYELYIDELAFYRSR